MRQNKEAAELKVLLVGNYVCDQQESMQRFVKVLLGELPKTGVQVATCVPAPTFGRLKPSPIGVGKWLGYVDKICLFPISLRRRVRELVNQMKHGGGKVVVHICDHSNAIYVNRLTHVPNVVTCNDMLAIRSARGEIARNPTRWSGRRLQWLIHRGLQRAKNVACISHATRNDLLRVTTLQTTQVRVIYMGLNHPYSPISQSSAWHFVERITCGNVRNEVCHPHPSYILHVGGNQWYKNRLGVLSVYATIVNELNASRVYAIPKLIMVGQPFTREMEQFMELHPELTGHVLPLEGVNNEDLRALYSAAGLLLFPSLDEGFGWPIIEAQACGCRVVTTKKAPMTEVGGDGAVYLDPATVDGSDVSGYERAGRVVLSVLDEDSDATRRRRQQGLENAKRFSTERMIEEYVESYIEIANGCVAWAS